MKKIVIVSVFVFVLMFSFHVFAQTVSWEIKQHSTDIKTLETEVTAYANQGYVPLGITYDNVELYILYVQDPDFGMEAWSIDWYKSDEDLQSGITEYMKNDYIPTGVTFTGDLFYVLYVQTDSSATAWQLLPSGTDLDDVQNTIQPYIKQGYLPVGVTALDGVYWILLLQVTDTTAQSWSLERYKVGSHSNQINRNIEQGSLPWGVMYRDDLIDILYVGF